MPLIYHEITWYAAHVICLGWYVSRFKACNWIFTLILGESAVIKYRWIGDSVVDLYHTEVPPSYRGKGLAQLLTRVIFSVHFTFTMWLSLKLPL